MSVLSRFHRSFIIIVIALFGLVVSGRPTPVQAMNVCGLISGDTIWIPANGLYIVTCNVIVQPGVTLTIEPGVVVKFDSLTALTIQGTLVARGTEANPITFTSNQASPTKGDWGYIHFTNSSTNATFDGNGIFSGGSIVQYAVIEYAGGTSVSENGALRVEDSAPYLDHNAIRNNKADGIHVWCNLPNCSSNEPRISNNTVTQNGIVGSVEAKGISVTRLGGFEYPNNCIITDNIVSNNASSGIHGTCSGGTISDNIVTNNIGSGIISGAGVTIIGNQISNNINQDTTFGCDLSVHCVGGGGIHAVPSWGTATSILSNTITGNTASMMGGGIYVWFANNGGSLTVEGNIIAGNTAGVGGGILVNSTGSPPTIIKDNVIANNTATGLWYPFCGGGLFVESDNYSMINNSVTDNRAPCGGGIIIQGTGTISSSTVINNEATQVDGEGGGIFLGNSNVLNDNNLYGNISPVGSSLYNESSSGGLEVNAEINYWGTTDAGAIESQVWHFIDDPNLGIVDYTPFRTSHNLDAPVSPPTGLSITPGGTSISLNWFPNPESDVTGYKVYYDIDSDFPHKGTGANEGNSPIDVGNNTSFTLTGLASGTQYFVAVTAYDTEADGVNDQTDGYESWFSDSPTLQTQNYVQVSYEHGGAASGAEVYHNGLLGGITDTLGRLTLSQPLQIGDTLSALQRVAQTQAMRNAHDGWAYRIYLSSLNIDSQGNTQSHSVTQPGPQLLTVRSDKPLILFNLVVSIEWDATDEYIAQIERAAQYASDYLYDLTDGQMAFGRVAIYDNGKNWADADIQISTHNTVRPHAYIGGITSNDKSHVIRVGRFWDGNSGNEGAWDQQDGFRTLTHEFGHYALYLYDEYFAYIFQNGNLVGEAPALCTGPENRNPATDATNASVMDHQYTTTELSARGVPGLWSPLCEQTVQWQLNGESTWETLIRKYADTTNPPRWQLTSPISRGSVLAGPTALPDHILALPTVTKNNDGASGPPRQLTIYYPPGQGYWGAIVALYKQGGRVIGQGFTDGNGRLAIYGAEAGDTIRAASFDGGLAGSITISSDESLDLTLASVGGLAVQAAGGIPHMRVRANPNPNPGQIDLFISLQNFGSNADPGVIVTEPGSEVGYAPTLSYSPVSGAYEGQISFSATERGMGRIRAIGAVGNSLVRLQSTYRLQRATPISPTHLFSNDGNLSLYVESGSLPGNEAYFVVMPPGAVPGPLPEGLALVGDPYDITASGAVVTLTKPAILSLRYDGALVNPALTPEGLGIYRWEPTSGTWQGIGGEIDEAQQAVTAPVIALGTYALLAPPGPWMEFPQENIFLPLILK